MATDQRRIVVVGAGSGIGAATAAHFHERGDHVLAVDLRPDGAAASDHAQLDLRDATQIETLLGTIGGDWDLLAYVAGVPGTAPAADVLKVNYLGMRLFVEGMLPLLREGGSVVTVASVAALGWQDRLNELTGLLEATDSESVERWQAEQDPNYPVYSTSKQAAIIYAKRLAPAAWQKYGVRVNTVSPGPTETPILGDFEESMGKDVLDSVKATIGRHATVTDIVPVIAFLGSPAARWVNGQDIHVDGGFVAPLTVGAPIQL
ncbi:coniferyl-alcohol dehydrogenase [Rhodococcus sp. HNM0563]|uniref:coniferyl-alcohol dehydrogenase n=1 Tax=unclassified Rhodococcus (in: high G+C Gram-positive bacteria) TaxID=192944 RepID=UPI00146D2131|nr:MULTISPECIES: coniferyl-alcohol dehydrogenase [unclassified Rhodococcus (in: high G+C Gram-positive bacteria)]MCK0091813.1 coniferyl-alcohol dehydrogenase [Rhodococcus sp. F64268]NLU64152.1 coniferyl-alcohol dehydrogenase [Rhodococcus sp. HNM0563]